jgi:membrane protein YdbS with pleckstrin-like domain
METLHARVQVLWVGFAVMVASVLAGIALAIDRFLTPIDVRFVAAGWVVLVALGAIHAVLRYRRWRFQLDEESLFLVRGVVTRVDTSVPFVRVQHVDTQRAPWERALGLSSVVVFTAGSRGADITIPGLRPERATELRERLRDLAIESEGSDAV